jgi:hypothetical protein
MTGIIQSLAPGTGIRLSYAHRLQQLSEWSFFDAITLFQPKMKKMAWLVQDFLEAEVHSNDIFAE